MILFPVAMGKTGGLAERLQFYVRLGQVDKKPPSAVFAVEHVADGPLARLVQFVRRTSVDGLSAYRARRTSLFWLAAQRATIGKTRFIGLQFEFLSANGAYFDGKCHDSSMLKLSLFFVESGPSKRLTAGREDLVISNGQYDFPAGATNRASLGYRLAPIGLMDLY
jgi:hypothetical protein